MATALGLDRHDSSEDYEIIPMPNGPVVSSPFPIANPRRDRTPSPSPDRMSRSRSRSPFSYFNQLFAGRSRHEQVSAQQQQESHEEAVAIATSVSREGCRVCR